MAKSAVAGLPDVEEPQVEEEDGKEEPSTSLPESLTRLVGEWRKAHHSDLTLRFRTGQAINKLYGSPEKRQPYGEGVILTFAEAIGSDKGEVSRMRRFAALAKNFEEFRAKHPKEPTWAAVKALLSGKTDSTGGERKRITAVIGQIKALAAGVNKSDFGTPDDDERAVLRMELRTLADVLAKRAGIKLTVGTIAAEKKEPQEAEA